VFPGVERLLWDTQRSSSSPLIPVSAEGIHNQRLNGLTGMPRFDERHEVGLRLGLKWHHLHLELVNLIDSVTSNGRSCHAKILFEAGEKWTENSGKFS
jgi:hypothetical protein